MAKYSHADVLDGMGNVIKANCNRICVCSSQPTTYTEAITTYELADVNVTSGDFTNAAFNTTGRMLTFAGKTSVNIDNSGTAQHLAFVDVANSKLLYVTTITSQVLTAGNTCDIPAVNICKTPQPS